MRQLMYLSPTSISLFYENITEFYLNYLADNRPPKLAQTQPMSVGSAFDAYAKSYLHQAIFGKGFDTKYSIDSIFEAQVEPHNRDWARKAGAYAFSEYKHCGALADLLLELQNSVISPRFEFEVKGIVNGEREGVERTIQSVPLLGKPDVFWMNKTGVHVIFDWKVNGFCSKYGASPMQGYVRLREGTQNRGAHKNAIVKTYKGMLINTFGMLEDFDETWARQLSIYAWLCGVDVGTEYIVAVDQLACKPGLPDMPNIKVAEHRLRVSPKHQWKILDEAAHVWNVVNSDHIFRDMSLEDSKNQCQALDGTVNMLKSDNLNDRWFVGATRQ